ncbi:hypothetical protein [Thioalkalivibrio sp. ALE11]|uniref:hypothetical protein n=1 Tax=Thioalkalivibrio sp. ALE11 TaxID=1265494 RepID=UPI001E615015|nr:hypothetical protein [Thioalkalivibrio sp. ALE11]
MRGLELFAERLAGFEDCYVLIGGSAAYLVQEDAGLEPRATRDLDIVLCVESLTFEFGQRMWEFIEEGGYESRQVGDKPRNFYRFSKPSDPRFPAMLEFFAREPGHLPLIEDSHLTPVPIDEAVVSLSAILLEADYYSLIHDHKREFLGVPVITEHALIPLKARAWLDLSKRKTAGEPVDSKNVKKHRNDIFRLSRLLVPGETVELPGIARDDMREFLGAQRGRLDAAYLKTLDIIDESGDEILDSLAQVYGVQA